MIVGSLTPESSFTELIFRPELDTVQAPSPSPAQVVLGLGCGHLLWQGV